MSKHHLAEITCPKCKNQDEFMVWESINTMLDPGMKEKVRTGEAFDYVCPKCGEHTRVYYTTLYHQMEDRIMIQLNLGDNIEQSIEMMKGIYRDAEGKIIEDAFPFMEDEYKNNRVVLNEHDFREKLYILDAGLDDHIVELVKLFLRVSISQDSPELDIEEFLFSEEDGNYCFAIRLADGKWGSVPFDMGFYENIKEFYEKNGEDNESVLIDYDWTLNYIHRIENK